MTCEQYAEGLFTTNKIVLFTLHNMITIWEAGVTPPANANIVEIVNYNKHAMEHRVRKVKI